jgi:protein-S-isoprenylcysteine O-methyltransferase Ste14
MIPSINSVSGKLRVKQKTNERSKRDSWTTLNTAFANFSEDLEMATFKRSTAYVIFCLAVLFGAGSLMAFLVFLLTGSPELISPNLRAREVLWWDAGLSIAFFIQHSGMVRKSFRQQLAHFLPKEYEGAVYAIVSGIFLLAVIVLWQKSSPVFTISRGVLRWLFYIAYLVSFAGFIWGVRALKVFDPYGLRPILGRLRGREPRSMSFVVRGPYRWVRHPLYLFMILMIWSCPDLTSDRLLFNGLWTVWIVMGSILEERDLVSEFGDAYRQYQRRVPMLIPRRIRPI